MYQPQRQIFNTQEQDNSEEVSMEQISYLDDVGFSEAELNHRI